MLESTLTVSPTDSGILVALSVENTGDDVVELQFNSGQHVEFYAFEADTGTNSDSVGGDHNGPVWRWSDERVFTQALETESLLPGETVSYDGTWEDPPSGTYQLVGKLEAENVDLRAEMTVTL